MRVGEVRILEQNHSVHTTGEDLNWVQDETRTNFDELNIVDILFFALIMQRPLGNGYSNNTLSIRIY